MYILLIFTVGGEVYVSQGKSNCEPAKRSTVNRIVKVKSGNKIKALYVHFMKFIHLRTAVQVNPEHALWSAYRVRIPKDDLNLLAFGQLRPSCLE